MRKLFAIVLLVALAACGTHGPAHHRFGMDDLDSINPNDTTLIDLKNLPPAPKGFAAKDVEALAVSIARIITRGLYDEKVWSTPSRQFAYDRVMEGLDVDMTRSLNESATESFGSLPFEQNLASMFGRDVDVVGRPKMLQAEWSAERDSRHGVVALHVRLATVTAYDLTTGRRSSVVAVRRDLGLWSDAPDRTDHVQEVLFATNAWGEDFCSLAVDGRLRPTSSENIYQRDMRDLVKEARAAPAANDDDATNKAYLANAKKCQSRSSTK